MDISERKRGDRQKLARLIARESNAMQRERLRSVLLVLQGLADLVPPPRKHRHRYHGVFGPNHKLRPAVTALAKRQRQQATGGHDRRAWERRSRHGGLLRREAGSKAPLARHVTDCLGGTAGQSAGRLGNGDPAGVRHGLKCETLRHAQPRR